MVGGGIVPSEADQGKGHLGISRHELAVVLNEGPKDLLLRSEHERKGSRRERDERGAVLEPRSFFRVYCAGPRSKKNAASKGELP